MRAREFLKEDKTYKPFLEQCKEVLPWLKAEFVKNYMFSKDDEKTKKIYVEYSKKLIRAVEAAIESGRNPAARRLVKSILPSNADWRDALNKHRATPSSRNFPSWQGRSQERQRRFAWLQAVKLGMELRKKFNFDPRLDKPPKSREEVEATLKRIADLRAEGKFVPWSIEGAAKLDLERLNSKEPNKVTEGGWQDTVTQKTKLTPPIVKAALQTAQKFIEGFNNFLTAHKQETIEMGHPTGSSAYHDVDDPNMEYGDIDLQIIVPDLEGKTANQLATHYNKLMDEYIATARPANVYSTGKSANGHPIFKLGKDIYVQVDFMWMPKRTAEWGRYRVTPMRGVKGLIYGNLYSTLGEIMNMSLQSSVLMKIKDGEPVNYQKSRKVDQVVEISKNIGTFGIDILEFIYGRVYGSKKDLKVDPMLSQHPGLNRDNVQISDLVKMIKGLAHSFTINDLYGKFNLRDIKNEKEFLKKFMDHYLMKAHEAGHGPKLNKATTPEELAKVEELRAKIDKGVRLVKQAFATV